MSCCWTKFSRWSRFAAIIIFLTASFAAYPLAFLRMSGTKIPYFGLAEAVTLPALGLAGTALLTVNCSWIKIYLKHKYLQFLGVVQIILLLLTMFHFFAGMVDFYNAALSLFCIIAPTLGVEYSNELRRILPLAGAFFALVLGISGIMSENFSGICGNWNWTQGMFFALLPGIFIFSKVKNYRRWIVVCSIATAGVFYLVAPEIFSRSVFLGVILVPLIIAGREKLPEKWYFPAIVSLFFIVVCAVLITAAAVDLPDSRMQLWKGSLDLLLDNAYSGCGMGRFSEVILPYLPEKYYFTAFAAPMHPHPHNEILNFFCSYGIAGVVFLGTLIFAALKNRPENKSQYFGVWIFLFLLVCGSFDVHCAVLPGAVWFLIMPGMLAAASAETFSVDDHQFRWQQLIRPAIALSGIIVSVWFSVKHFEAGIYNRNGEIALGKGDFAAGKEALEKSLSTDILPHAAYRLAELYLHVFNEPQKCIDVLDKLSQKRKINNYLHSYRLRAVAYAELGRIEQSRAALALELRNYPYSIINTRLELIQKQLDNAPETEQREVWEKLLKLCALRKISVAEAAKISAEADDRGYDTIN